MLRCKRRAVLGTAIVAALASPAAATAQVPTLPLEVRGVTAVNGSGGAVRVVFGDSAARLYRRVARRTVIATCQRVGDPAGALLLRLDRSGELVRRVRAPARRRPIRLRGRAAGAGFDVCRLVAGRFRGRGGDRRFARTLRLQLPLTQAGAAYLRDHRLGDRMVATLDLVASNGSGGRYPAFDAVASFIPRLVQLASPDATPVPNRVGLYTDAAQHVTVVAVGVLGARLFIDVNGPALTTNVPEVVAG